MTLGNAQLIEVAQRVSVDAATQAAARRCLLDWVGCALGGAGSDAAVRAREVLAPGPGSSTLFGGDDTVSARDAAFANAVAGHALDYDDENVWLFGHPAATIAPAVMALAECRDVSLEKVLRAMTVGYEAAALLGRFANPGHYLAGWHASATLGALAASVACADLLNLEEDQTSTCLTLGTVQASGLRVVFGSDVKAIQVGAAASSAVLAAQFAGRFDHRPPDSLNEYLAMVGASATSNHVEDAQTTRPAILDTSFKWHATCGATHCAIEAVACIVQGNDLAPGEIEALRVYVDELAFQTAGIVDPTSRHEAQFCLSYLAALAATAYPITPAVLWPASEQVAFLQERCEVRITDEFRGDYHNPARVEIVLRTGEVYSHTVRHARGSVPWPLSDDDLVSKFVQTTSGVLGEVRTKDLQEFILEAPGSEPVRDLGLRMRGTDPASVGSDRRGAGR